MNKSLYEIVRNYAENHKSGLKAAGLAGIIALSAAGLLGCESVNKKTLIGTAMKVIAPNSKTQKGAYQATIIGDALIGEGQAESGKSDQNITINNNIPQQPQNNNPPRENNNYGTGLPEGVTIQNNKYFITCNYFEDLDGRGLDYPEDYAGIKKRFTTKEKVTYVMMPIECKKGDKVKFILKDNRGDIIANEVYEAKKDEILFGRFVFKPGKLPEGTNKGIWYQNDKFVGFSEVEVAAAKDKTEEKKEENSDKKSK